MAVGTHAAGPVFGREKGAVDVEEEGQVVGY